MKTTRLFCAVLSLLFAQQLSNAQGQALTITTNATLPQAVFGEAMTSPFFQLEATGGTKPYTWSLVSGSQALVGKIAPGLSVAPTGQLVGNATTLQRPVGFTVQVADSSSPKKIATKVLIIAVVSATPKISSVSMEPATIGVGYSWTFNATDGKLPYTWSANSTLPAGLTLNSTTGALSGNISSSQSPGNFTLTITVSGSNGKSASGNFVLRIKPALEWVTQPALPSGKVATTYNATLTVSGGKSPYSFATKNGSTLPSGLTLNGTTGRLSGAPTAAGNFSFTITAKDSGSPATTIERTFTLAVQAYGMSVSGPTAISGQQYNAISPATYSVSGGVAPYSWSTVPALPTALSINATTGVISGNLSAAGGNYSVAVTVKDKGNQTASQNVTLSVSPAPPLDWVTQPALPSGKVATTYNATLTVSGGKSPYSFATKNGSTLPSGLTLNGTTGRLSGAPTAAGNFSFTITAKDSGSPATTIERTFTLAVQAYGMSVSGPTAISGQQYNAISPATYSVSGGVAPYSWSTVPALPTALSINATTGVISGNLSAAGGNYSVAVTVKDKGNQTASQNVTLSVSPAPPLDWVTQPALPSGKVATTYNATLTVSGGKSPYSFATKNGSTLPSGLTLNGTTGRLSGAPTAAGNFSFTITAKDSGSPATTIERTFTLAVQAYGMSVSGPTAISGQQYNAISPATYSVSGGVAPYSWSTVPALPTALSINATTGVISGNLSAAGGNYSVAVTVKDKGNQTASQNVTLSVSPAPPLDWVTQPALPSGKVATTYNATLTVSGGKSPYSFATKNGSTLPSGLTLNGTTGRLSGAPTAAGNFSFTITAKDSGSPATTIERIFTISIASYGMAITDNSPSEITGTQFQPLPRATFSVTGGRPAYVWSSTPTPPAGGLTLNATTGILSGVPTTAGNTTISVRVTDGASQTAIRNCTIRILPAGNLTITTASPLPSGSMNASYSTTLTASGGKPFLTANQSTYYNWTIANRGNLPTNFTLNATSGILSGTANAVLTANFTVRVTDAANAFATKNCSLQITASLDAGDADGDGVNNYREAYDGTDPFDPKSFNPLSMGLVAHYPFEGKAKDESGYGKNGKIVGSVVPSVDRFGDSNKSYYFDGATGTIATADSALTKVENNFTLVTWIKASEEELLGPESTSGTSYAHKYVVGGLHGGGDSGISIAAGTNGISVMEHGHQFLPVVLSYPAQLNSKWVQVVVTCSNNAAPVLYLDGKYVRSGLNSGRKKLLSVFAGDDYQGIGGGGYGRFKGNIDDIRIYNRALSAAEVSQLYSEESGEPNMVLVQGGTLPAGSALANQTVSAFHIAHFETTWAEWKQVRTWAAANGYDIGNAGQGSADNHPVRNVSWYDSVKWLNAKSQMEEFMPVYSVNGTTYKTGQSTPTVLATANGYRLPAEAEWEWAARGGITSQGYTYSGGNDPNQVAWYIGNIDGKFGTKPVGMKSPNELGIHDMSGNVWEFVWNPASPTDSYRIPRGGMWNTGTSGLALNSRFVNNPSYNEFYNWGFRYARNAIGDMVTVQGGTLPGSYGLSEQGVQAFQIGRTEVTWDEWQTVRTWAVANGYTDLAGVGNGTAGTHPVRNVSWYDVVKWSNAKSQMEGLTPVYSVNGTTYKTGLGVSTPDSTANGYRLPGEAEWEWAARGGIVSKGYSYSGGNNLAEVGWYRGNSEGAVVDLSSTLANSKAGTGTWPVAQKKPNELGLFDMSGNISEWCWDKGNADSSQIGGYQRHLRGPSWYNDTIEASIIHRTPYGDPSARIAVTGLRLARNIGPKISITGTLPEATLNQAYAGYTFGAVSSTGDKVWSISEGTLPPGMSFSANGTLSGTPTTAGTYTFVIRLESSGYWDEVEVEFEVVAKNIYRLFGLRTDTDELVEINKITGDLRTIFKLPIDVGTFTGFDCNPVDGFLYVAQAAGNGTIDFYKIDPVNKSATKTKSITGTGDGSLESIGFKNDGNLYAYDERSAFSQGIFYFINWTTSTAQALGSSGTPSILGGDYDAVRNVFWAGDEWNGKIYQLSLTNSSIQWTSNSTWSTGPNGDFYDMDVTPDGEVLAVASTSSSPKLSILKLDPETKTWAKFLDLPTGGDIRIASV